MVKKDVKTDKIKSKHDFDIDLEAEYDEFDVDSIFDDKPKDGGRVTVTGLTKSFLGNLKDQFLDFSRLKEHVKNFLPSEIRSDVSALEEEVNLTKESFSKAKKQIKDSASDAAEIARSVLPENWKKSREFFGKYVKPKEEETSSGKRQDPTEAAIAATLSQIFDKQIAQAESIHKEEQAEAAVREKIKEEGEKANLGALNSINLNLQKLTDYNSKIAALYQKKSLEIQLRSLTIQQNQFQMLQKYTQISAKALDSIIHNTALPDFVKITRSEMFKKQFAEKWVSKTIDLVGKSSAVKYIKGAFSGMREKVMGGVNTLTDLLSGAKDMKDNIDEIMEMDPSKSRAQAYADMGMGVAASTVAGWMMSKLKGTQLGKTIINKAKRAKASADNMPAFLGRKKDDIKNWTKKQKIQYGLADPRYDELTPEEREENERNRTNKEDNPALIPNLWGLLKIGLGNLAHAGLEGGSGAISGDSIIRYSVDNAKTLAEPAIFNRGVEKSIVTIIPGYLARILQQATIIATGNPNAPLLSYNHKYHDFVSEKKAFKQHAKKLNKFAERNLGQHFAKFRDSFFGNDARAIFAGKEDLLDDLMFDLTQTGTSNISEAKSYERLVNRNLFKRKEKFTQEQIKKLKNAGWRDGQIEELQERELTNDDIRQLTQAGLNSDGGKFVASLQNYAFNNRQRERIKSSFDKWNKKANGNDEEFEEAEKITDQLSWMRSVLSGFDVGGILSEAHNMNPDLHKMFSKIGLVQRKEDEYGNVYDEINRDMIKLLALGKVKVDEEDDDYGFGQSSDMAQRVFVNSKGEQEELAEGYTVDEKGNKVKTEEPSILDNVLGSIGLGRKGKNKKNGKAKISPIGAQAYASSNNTVANILAEVKQIRSILSRGTFGSGVGSTLTDVGSGIVGTVGAAVGGVTAGAASIAGKAKGAIMGKLDEIRSRWRKFRGGEAAQDPLIQAIAEKTGKTPEEIVSMPQDQYRQFKQSISKVVDNNKGLLERAKGAVSGLGIGKIAGILLGGAGAAAAFGAGGLAAGAAGVAAGYFGYNKLFGAKEEGESTEGENKNTLLGKIKKLFSGVDKTKDKALKKLEETRKKAIEAIDKGLKEGVTKQQIEEWYKAQKQNILDKTEQTKAALDAKWKEAKSLKDKNAIYKIVIGAAEIVAGFVGVVFSFGGTVSGWVLDIAKAGFNTVAGAAKGLANGGVSGAIEGAKEGISGTIDKIKDHIDTAKQFGGIFGTIAPGLAKGATNVVRGLLSGGGGITGMAKFLGNTYGNILGFGDLGDKVGETFDIGKYLNKFKKEFKDKKVFEEFKKKVVELHQKGKLTVAKFGDLVKEYAQKGALVKGLNAKKGLSKSYNFLKNKFAGTGLGGKVKGLAGKFGLGGLVDSVTEFFEGASEQNTEDNTTTNGDNRRNSSNVDKEQNTANKNKAREENLSQDVNASKKAAEEAAKRNGKGKAGILGGLWKMFKGITGIGWNLFKIGGKLFGVFGRLAGKVLGVNKIFGALGKGITAILKTIWKSPWGKKLGNLWKVTKAVGKDVGKAVGASAKGLIGRAAIVGTAYTVVDTFVNAETGTEKGKGYGTALGGAIGSGLGMFLGPLGTIAGGALGAYVGGVIGEWLTKPGDMTWLRLHQYGLTKNETDKINSILKFELHIGSCLVTQGGGKIEVDESKIRSDKINELFGIDLESDNATERMEEFNKWMYGRFLPVFCKHASVLVKLKSKIDLPSVDSFKNRDAFKYLANIKNVEGLDWSCSSSPFGDEMGSGAKDAFDALFQKLWDAIPENYKKGEADLTTEVEKNNSSTPSNQTYNGLTKVSNNQSTQSKKVNIVASSGASDSRTQKTTALDHARFKTYGIYPIEPTMVVLLRSLEDGIEELVTNNNGSITLDIDKEKIVEKVGSLFYISKEDIDTEKGNIFFTWFEKRFLVVFLKYLNEVYNKIKETKRDAIALKLREYKDQLDIALIITKLPVWEIDANPFGENYNLNMKPESVKPNILYLQDKVREGATAEENATNISKSTNQEYQGGGTGKKGKVVFTSGGKVLTGPNKGQVINGTAQDRAIAQQAVTEVKIPGLTDEENKRVKEVMEGKYAGSTNGLMVKAGLMKGIQAFKIPDNVTPEVAYAILVKAGNISPNTPFEKAKPTVEAMMKAWATTPATKIAIENKINQVNEEEARTEYKNKTIAERAKKAEVKLKADMTDAELKSVKEKLKGTVYEKMAENETVFKSAMKSETVRANIEKTLTEKNFNAVGGTSVDYSSMYENVPTVTRSVPLQQVAANGSVNGGSVAKGGSGKYVGQDVNMNASSGVGPDGLSLIKRNSRLNINWSKIKKLKENGNFAVLGDLIASKESKAYGLYCAANQPRTHKPMNLPDLPRKTVGEVKAMQRNKEVLAVGKYQYIPKTLIAITKAAGIKDTDLFDERTQERMFAESLLGGSRKRICYFFSADTEEEAGPRLAGAAEDMALEWASLEYKPGSNQPAPGYASAGNKVGVTRDKVDRALMQQWAVCHGKGNYVSELPGSAPATTGNGVTPTNPSGGTNGAAAGTYNNGNGTGVQPFMEKVISIMTKNAQGAKYSQELRSNPGYYDCSSFVCRALKQAGLPIDDTVNTKRMIKELPKHGFVWNPIKFGNDVSMLQRGDILLRYTTPAGHVETYLGNKQVIGAHGSKSGVGVKAFWDDNYDGYFRFNGKAPANVGGGYTPISGGYGTSMAGKTAEIENDRKGGRVAMTMSGVNQTFGNSPGIRQPSTGGVETKSGSGLDKIDRTLGNVNKSLSGAMNNKLLGGNKALSGVSAGISTAREGLKAVKGVAGAVSSITSMFTSDKTSSSSTETTSKSSSSGGLFDTVAEGIANMFGHGYNKDFDKKSDKEIFEIYNQRRKAADTGKRTFEIEAYQAVEKYLTDKYGGKDFEFYIPKAWEKLTGDERKDAMILRARKKVQEANGGKEIDFGDGKKNSTPTSTTDAVDNSENKSKVKRSKDNLSIEDIRKEADKAIAKKEDKYKAMGFTTGIKNQSAYDKWKATLGKDLDKEETTTSTRPKDNLTAEDLKGYIDKNKEISKKNEKSSGGFLDSIFGSSTTTNGSGIIGTLGDMLKPAEKEEKKTTKDFMVKGEQQSSQLPASEYSLQRGGGTSPTTQSSTQDASFSRDSAAGVKQEGKSEDTILNEKMLHTENQMLDSMTTLAKNMSPEMLSGLVDKLIDAINKSGKGNGNGGSGNMPQPTIAKPGDPQTPGEATPPTPETRPPTKSAINLTRRNIS